MVKIGKFLNFGKKLFQEPSSQLRLSHITTGNEAPKLVKSELLFGKNGKEIAKVKSYTQLGQEVTNNNTIGKTIGIRYRDYIPSEGSRLAKLGILKVRTSHTPYGQGIYALASLPNGKVKILNCLSDIRNYIKLMG